MAIKCTSPFLVLYLFLTPPSPRFNIYILDYCKKRGYRKTANELVAEADISPDSKPPINAQQGLLFEFVPLCSLSTRLIRSLGGGAYFGCYFRPKTMVPDLRMQCSTTRCFTSVTSIDTPHLVFHCFSLVSSIRIS